MQSAYKDVDQTESPFDHRRLYFPFFPSLVFIRLVIKLLRGTPVLRHPLTLPSISEFSGNSITKGSDNGEDKGILLVIVAWAIALCPVWRERERTRDLPPQVSDNIDTGQKLVVDGRRIIHDQGWLFTRAPVLAGANDVLTPVLTSQRIIQRFNYDVCPEGSSILQAARCAGR